MISPSIAARFDIHNPDFSEEAAFRRRAEKAGRTLGQQIAWEEACADAITAQQRAAAAERYRAKVRLWGGASFFERSDPWPTIRGTGHFRGDPAEGEWS